MDVELLKTILALAEDSPVKQATIKMVQEAHRALLKAGEDVKCLEKMKTAGKESDDENL